MRNRKAFLSAAIGAAVLIAGTVAMAGGPGTNSTSAAVIVPPPPPTAPPPPPTSCSPVGSESTFTVSSGPSIVGCGDELGLCPCNGDPTALCTQIEYQLLNSDLQPSTGTVLALEGENVVSVYPHRAEGYEIFPPCDGDFSGFGFGACHEQAVSIDLREGDNGKFTITLGGERRSGPTSVAILGEGPMPCRILGIGLDNLPIPDQITQTSEQIDFKGCVVTFLRDARTGDVTSAALDPVKSTKPLCTSPSADPKNCCNAPFAQEDGTLIPKPVDTLVLQLPNGNTTSFLNGKFGDGYISTGGDSCTTRVIGGRVYTWGTPCP